MQEHCFLLILSIALVVIMMYIIYTKYSCAIVLDGRKAADKVIIYKELKDEEKAKVVTVYRRYYRGKWYKSDTPLPGYNKYYVATKVRVQLFYRDRENAQRDADKYNKWKQDRSKTTFPDRISWYDFKGTELHNQRVWYHDSGSWLYNHGFDDWKTKDLLSDVGDMEKNYDDSHSTVDFFKLLFMVPNFADYELKKGDNGMYSIVAK